jgi:glycerol-3-phosphate dehydrogenase
MARAYGDRISVLLQGCDSVDLLGREFGAGLTEAELRYLAIHEWARTAEDVLMRRSKLGLHMSKSQKAAVAVALDHMV